MAGAAGRRGAGGTTTQRALVIRMALAAGVVAVAAVLPMTAAGASTVLATLTEPGSPTPQTFGYSVAISGTTAIVGSFGTNTAYIYTMGAGGWPTTPTATLHDPVGRTYDYFGLSVAISGSTAVVGSPGVNDRVGAAYVYTMGAGGWPITPTATLHGPGTATMESFGTSVSVSGNTVVVGAPTYKHVGAAYVYTMGAAGWPSKPTKSLHDPGGHIRDYFGWSVSVSGSALVVGAYGTDGGRGEAYVYTSGSTGWHTSPAARLRCPASATSETFFGLSVAVSGTTIVVGAPTNTTATGTAYLFVKSGGTWPSTPTTTLADPAAASNVDGDDFGLSVAVSGTTVVVGAPVNNDGNPLSVYFYAKGAGGWPSTPTSSLTDPGGSTTDEFGWSVATAASGTVVDAYNTKPQGVVYIVQP